MKVYAKIRAPGQGLFQVLFLLPFLLLAGCGGGGGYGYGAPWVAPGNNGVVTNDPARLPDIGWQTQDQRQDLNREAAAAAAQAQAQQAPATAPPPQRKITAALLLPLTGKNAELGQSMLKAAQMALFDVGSANFELKPVDTKGTPAGAASAAQTALGDGASLILGPIYSEDLKAVRAVAGGTPVISFSTDWTQGGGNTYIMGFLPFTQLARVISYAQAHGASKFAVYAPQTEYCDIVINTLHKLNTPLARVERYAPGQSDLGPLVADFAAKSKAPDGRLNFDAIVLPVGGESARTLISMLDTNGVSADKVRFVGTGLWDDPALARTPSIYGGWYAAPDPKLRADFEKRYLENYESSPARLASLAYDATALAAVLAHTDPTGTPYSRDHLTAARGFAGIDGIFRFRSDNLAERGLAVLEIQSGKPKVLDPAPTAFISGS